MKDGFEAGFPIITTLPPQMRHNRIHLSKFRPIKNQAKGWGPISVKPHGTGIWTSSYTPDNPEGASDWLRWCKAEDFCLEMWRNGYVYEVAKNLKIVEIDSLDDLMHLNDVFGVEDESTKMLHAKYPEYKDRRINRWPNWEKLAKHFDAVHLTEKGQWETRMPPEGDNLYGWDCESTLWLRLHRNTMKFVKKINLGLGVRHKTREEYRADDKIRRSTMNRMMEQWKKDAVTL